MANTRSAQKAQRQTERRTVRNRTIRSSVRTYLKNAQAALKEGAAPTLATVVNTAISNLDRAAKRGIIHRNKAARDKSRLMSKLHRLSILGETQAAAEVAAPTPAKKVTRATAARKPAQARATSRGGATHSTAAARRASAVKTATTARERTSAPAEPAAKPAPKPRTPRSKSAS